MGAIASAAAFESINASASSEAVETWIAEEAHAQQERARNVAIMDIYDIKMKQCEPDDSMLVLLNIWLQSHPVQKYFWS